uniref:stage II sporulation protein R n=1 Tax=Neobacillus endophyticus TaxID=2738405 RepID=UPI0028AB80FE|nr:stage II sporulation protein R [Neobacillus endophyticus]
MFSTIRSLIEKILNFNSLRFWHFVHNDDSEGTVLEMRGKVVVWAYLILLSFGTMLSLYMPKTEAAAKESIVIPGEAIRLRILANSDLDADQALKRKVRDAVNAQITLWVQDLTSMEKARVVIKEKLPEIKAIAEKVVQEQGSNQTVKVQFGKVQFPTKLYGQFLYPAGEYQAVLITLGKGEGANWWCVLYPPLCFLDFSNGVAVSRGFNDKVEAAENKSPESDGKKEVPSTADQMADKNQNQNKQKGQNDSNSADNQDSNGRAVKNQNDSNSADNQDSNGRAVKNQNDSNSADNQDSNGGAVKNQNGSNSLENQGSQDQAVKNQNEEDDADPKDSGINTTSEDEKSPNADKESLAADENPPAHKSVKQRAPVYTAEDEQPVKVKFFVVELWEKLFD